MTHPIHFEVTEEMVVAAMKAFDANISAHDQWASRGPTRAAIEAAFASAPVSADTEKLLEQIAALLELDAIGALVPHGIGGLARELLGKAYIALSPPTPGALE